MVNGVRGTYGQIDGLISATPRDALGEKGGLDVTVQLISLHTVRGKYAEEPGK